MSEERSLSLGTEGERDWRYLRSAYLLGPEKGCSLLISDSGEVRSEVRRRMESMAPTTIRLEPSLDVLYKIHELAAAAPKGQPPLVWIEARESEEPELAWADGLRALNRGRDLLWDEGPVYVVLAGPKWFHRQLREGAPDLSSTINPAVILSDTLELLAEPTEPLCWLHISDLHVRSADWQQDVVLKALLRDLPGLLTAAERTPQLLFVTGDVANRGVESEYDGAFGFLDKLCVQLGLERQQVFMVPGNHDVDRSAITPAVRRSEKLFDSLEDDEDEFRTAIGEIVGSLEEMRRYGVRLASWCRFTGRFLGLAKQVAIDQPWRSDIIEVAGVQVGVASICSAWLSGPDDAKGKIVVGERQVRQLVDELRQGGAQLRVALLHHPLAWLREAEEKHVRALLRNEFDVVLHGHAHHPEAGTFVHGDRDTVEIGAGATYTGLGKDRFHGIQVAQLDVEAGKLVIDAFTWSTRNGGHWHVDSGFHRDAPTGRMAIPLRLARVGSAGASPQPGALAARLRRATLQVHGAQGFIGLPSSAPRPKATLHDMFVPLQLRRRREEGGTVELESLRAKWLGEAAARAVILGDPGAGKSTLCRYLAVEAAGIDSGPVPILLTVRDWAAEGAREGILELALRHVERHLGIRADLATLTSMCANGKVLLLIDGVDETGAQERVQLRDRLHAFVGEHPRVGVIVTSRILGYDDAPLSDEQFEHFVLEPFDEARLRDFIARWYAVAEPNDPSERQRRSAELWAALQAEPRAMGLARNPLLATLIAMVHFHRAQLPGDRARLYALCIELMVVTWPAACGRTLVELEGFRQMPMLEELALWMQSQRPDRQSGEDDQRGILITGAQLDRQLGELLDKHHDDLDVGRRRALADKWRRWLVRESGLIQEQRDDRFGLLHLSLMEYLAGQAALREQSREGHAAIARFVVELHRKPQWRETLLLMLGSRNDDRELGNAVVEKLLAVEHSWGSWSTYLFLLSLLREEIDIDPALRTGVLNIAAILSGDRWSSDWEAARSLIADILRFGCKHGPPLRQWIEEGMAVRQGESLVDELVILPDDVEPTKVMAGRSDESLELGALLNLGPAHRWGRWAAGRASETTWLRWIEVCASGEIVFRVLGLGLFHHPEVWVAAVMRRIAWLARIFQRAAVGSLEQNGSGLPARLQWMTSARVCEVVLVPAIVGCAPEVSVTESVQLSPRDFIGDVMFWLITETAMKYNWDLSSAVGVVTGFPQSFNRPTPQEPAQWISVEGAQAVMRTYAPSSDLSGETVVSVERKANPPHEAQAPTRAPDFAFKSGDAGDAARSAKIAEFAEAHAGFLLAPSGEPAQLITEARAQNRWLNLFLDPLVDYTTRESPLTPQQQALFLALGLAQFQTTWSWPAGPHWKSWFTADPPEYWLAAYIWQLCWAVGEPTNPDHLPRAHACLDRADDPELVAELRKYPIIPTPPEVYALFDGSGGDPQ